MNKPFIIAEISGNHLGSFDKAMQLVKAAAVSGADAVKFQTFKPEDMAVDYTLTDGPWKGRTLKSLYKETYLPWEWHQSLFDYAKHLKIVPFSSPFSAEAVDFLETLDCQIYKIASFELIDTPLIRYVAKTGKQIILSTGMASRDEIQIALEAARFYGPRNITLLHCTSTYPAPVEDVALDLMVQNYFTYKVHSGLSDHTQGIGVAVSAAGHSANVIEKHLCLDRRLGGPDAEFSLEPLEFAQMVKECRRAAAAGGLRKNGSEKSSLKLRRTLYFSRNLEIGDIITEQDLMTRRPALGLSPQVIDNIVGKSILIPTKRGDPVTWSHVDADNHRK